MLASLDGRIVVDRWPLSAEGRRQYELIHASYDPDGWICGRVTMEPFAKRVRSEAEIEAHKAGTSAREDFTATGEFESYAFALDASGRLAWESNDIDGDHVVAILSERVSDEYLDQPHKTALGRYRCAKIFPLLASKSRSARWTSCSQPRLLTI